VGAAEGGLACAAAGGVADAGDALAASGVEVGVAVAAGAGLVVALPEVSEFEVAAGVAGAASCAAWGFALVSDGVAAAGATVTGAALAGAALIGLSPVALDGSAKAAPAEAASRSATAVETSSRSTRIPGITYSPSRPTRPENAYTLGINRPQSWHLPLWLRRGGPHLT